MRFLFPVLLALLSLTAHAQDLEAYTGRATVADESPGERGRAMREAMAVVINRITGDAAAAASPRGQTLLIRANLLSRSTGYEMGEDNQLQLVVSFQPDALENALRQAGLPVFGVYASSIEEVPLSVSGLGSVKDYVRTVSFLRRQPGMKSLAVTELSNGTLQLRARIEGGTGRLAGALTVGNVLKRDISNSGGLAYLLIH